MSRRNPKHYVNNADFTKALSEYQAQVKKAQEEGKEIPLIPRYIGECIYDIANRLSYNYNFKNYSYRDEMISDGIENAIAYGVKSFNPEKSKNPFAYFTQIIYYAFLRRIAKEKKDLYTKYKATEKAAISGEAFNSDSVGTNISMDYLGLDNEYMTNFVQKYEEDLRKKKEKASKKGLEKFIEE